MNRYLLLRDNKQSGPYSVPELIEKGIKPYDLVWLDGKSAAWRYPSEIEELKVHAPIVEEQPFDRFYKKPASEKHFAEVAMTSREGASQFSRPGQLPMEQPHTAQPTVPEVYIIKPKETNSPTLPAESAARPAEVTYGRSSFEPVQQVISPLPEGQRKIYVTLPGSKPVSRQGIEGTHPSSPALPSDKLTERPGNPARDNNREFQPVPVRPEQNQTDRFVPSAKYKKVESDYKKNDVAEASFSSKFAGADLLTDTVFPVKSKKFVFAGKQNAAITIIGALCLLLGGIIIGLAISNSKKESAKELNALVKQIQERERLKQLPASQPVINTEKPVEEAPAPDLPPAEELVVNKRPATNANTQSRLAAGNTVSKNDPDKSVAAVQPEVRDVQTVSVKPEELENNNQGNAAVELARKNIRQLVSVQNNKYKTGVLGGISELLLTVSNKSDFEIDQVEVEVAYLGPEKRVVKTQTIVFNNIQPGGQVSQEVPRTNRGVTVTTSIKVINSRSLGLTLSGI